MRAPVLQLNTTCRAKSRIASLPPHSLAQTRRSQPASSSASPSYAGEPVVIEHNFDTAYQQRRCRWDGWKKDVLVARMPSTRMKRYSVLTIPYAGNSQHVEIDFARVTHADGTVVETRPAGAMDLPAAVTRVAPFYSDIKSCNFQFAVCAWATSWSSNTAS